MVAGARHLEFSGVVGVEHVEGGGEAEALGDPLAQREVAAVLLVPLVEQRDHDRQDEEEREEEQQDEEDADPLAAPTRPATRPSPAVAPSASLVSISTNESSARYCEVFTH